MVVVDLVESVHLMQVNEADVITRWRQLLAQVRGTTLPQHQGRLVKSLGDGLLLEFETVPAAIGAVLAIQRLVNPLNQGRPTEQQLRLRGGVHEAEVVVDDIDVFGSGVNLAARLATLAGPGEVVVSSEVAHQILVGIDADLEDMGECYLKHIPEPVRSFRVWPVGSLKTRRPLRSNQSMRPSVVVLPFAAAADAPIDLSLRSAMTDNLVSALGRLAHWVVISRLSTAALAGRALSPAAAASIVNAQYAVSGTVDVSGDRIELRIEVFESRINDLIWEGSRSVSAAQLFDEAEEMTRAFVGDLTSVLLSRQLQVAHEAALPTLPGYALLLHGIAMLHSLSRSDLHRAREALEHLSHRHPRSPEAKAWLAKWHFLQLAQATTSDRDADIARARGLIAAALECDPQHGLAMAIDGHMMSFVDGRAADSIRRLEQAVAESPNEPLGWLFLSGALASADRGAEAVVAVEQAHGLSPIDPLSYYYDLFAANAYSAAGRHEEALGLTQTSLARNALHLSSWVQLIIEQVLTGRMDEARRSARHYLAMRPTASVKRFLERHNGRETSLAQREAQALLEAGLPL